MKTLKRKIKKILIYLAVFAFIVNSTLVSELIPEAKANIAGDNIVINEIQTSGSTASDEFVELYNPTSNSINVTGWTLKYKSATGTTWTTRATLNGSIAPHGYYLAGSGIISIIPDTTWSATLADSGGHVKLVDASASQVDLVGYGSADSAEGGAPADAPAANGSIERTDGIDTDNNSNDFSLRTVSDPQNSFSPAPIITVDSLRTNDTTPKITGTVNDPNATINVNIGGNGYNGANNGDGTWKADITDVLSGVVYDVIATATDLGGNISTDATTNELTIDLIAPEISIFSASPNPFSPDGNGNKDETTISYGINEPSQVKIDILTVADELVKTFEDTAYTTNGQFIWDGKDQGGNILSDGSYAANILVTDKADNDTNDTMFSPIVIDLTGPTGNLSLDTNIPKITNNSNPIISGAYSGGEIQQSSTISIQSDISQIVVQFEEQSGKLYQKEANFNQDTGVFTTENSNPYEVMANGLSQLPDGTYSVRVLAFDINGASVFKALQDSLTIDTQAPQAVANLQVTAKTPNSITLSWTASGSSDIAGYRLYWGTEKGKYTSARDVGNVTAYTLSGLNPTTTYYFYITAYDKASNESSPSNVVEEKTTSALSSGISTKTEEPKGIIESAQAASPQEEQKAEEKETQTKRKSNLFWIALIILILGVAGYYYYNQNPDKFKNIKFPRLPGIK